MFSLNINLYTTFDLESYRLASIFLSQSKLDFLLYGQDGDENEKNTFTI